MEIAGRGRVDRNDYPAGDPATLVSYDDSQWRPDPGLQSYEGYEMWTHYVGPHEVDCVCRDEDDVETVFREVFDEEFDGDFDEEFGHLFEDGADGDADG